MVVQIRVRKNRGLMQNEFISRMARAIDRVITALQPVKNLTYQIWKDNILESLNGELLIENTYSIPDLIGKVYDKEISDKNILNSIEVKISGYVDLPELSEPVDFIIHNIENSRIYGNVEIWLASDEDWRLFEVKKGILKKGLPQFFFQEKLLVSKIVAGPSPDSLEEVDGFYRFYPDPSEFASDLISTFRYTEADGEDIYNKLFGYVSIDKVVRYISKLREYNNAVKYWSGKTQIELSEGSLLLYSREGKLTSFYQEFKRDYILPLTDTFIHKEDIEERLREPLVRLAGNSNLLRHTP